MPGSYIVYGGGLTRSVGVEAVLCELELPYELIELDTSRSEHRAPGFLAINPSGYLPALVTPGGMVLHENAAIMLWLAETHGSVDLAPAVNDSMRGVFLSKLFYHTNDIQPALKRYFYPSRYAPHPDSVGAARALARDAALERWGVLDTYLASDGPFHLGERFSLLDLHMAVWAAYGLESGDEIVERFCAVGRCFELVLQRPGSGALILKLWRKVKSQSADVSTYQ